MDRRMTKQKDMFNLIKSFSGQNNILTAPKLFIDLMGSIEGGLFLSQLLYWSDKTKNQYGWFYKTYQDWYDEIRLSKYQIAKYVKICESKDFGFLKTKVKKANNSPTLHYKINEDAFKQWLVKNLTFKSEKTSLSYNREYNEQDFKHKSDPQYYTNPMYRNMVDTVQ